jgi:acyl-CoA synthetase (AMP-forming)/AMP-acid ligase II
MSSIIEVIERRLETNYVRNSFNFLENGDNLGQILSLRELRNEALNISIFLPPGATVLIFLPQGLPFIKAFFACLYAGGIAVPGSLPTKKRGLEKINKIVKDAEIQLGITNRNTLANLKKWLGEDFSKIGIKWIFIEDFEGKIEKNLNCSEFTKPNQLAFLQYTSGSTDQPKAVKITHENIIANSTIIRECFQNTSESRSVCWLPSFHDMGLIDGVIQPIFSDFPAVLMSPTHFLQRPARWLKAISQHKATYVL